MHYRTLLNSYTAQVLQWQFGQAVHVMEDPLLAQRTADRLLRALNRAQNNTQNYAGHKQMILLGVGDGTLVRLLSEGLPPACALLVLDDNPQRVRQVLQQHPTLFAEKHSPLLGVDSSPWALLMLCRAFGFDATQCVLGYNPACKQLQAESMALAPLEQWRRLFLGSKRLELHPADVANLAESLSLACIAHPDEELLADFLAQVPPWVAEVVLLWDGLAPPTVPPCAAPVRQHIRPLNGDFAAQRNALLALCKGDWCLYLDVDEALSPHTWAALPAWMSLRVAGEKAGAIILPRETFMGGTESVRMGYGLWPDVQVRLFPLHSGLCFEGAVHERLTGIQGPYLLAEGHALLHYSHACKSRASLVARLQVFDQAAGQPRHVLSEAYPCLPVNFFAQVRQQFGMCSLLQLPPLAM